MSHSVRSGIAALLLCAACAAAVLGADVRRSIMLVLNAGDRSQAAAQEITARGPDIRLVLPWPAGREPDNKTLELVRSGRVEPVLMILDEPLLAMVCEVRLSTDAAALFAAPDDAQDILARAQDEFSRQFGRTSRGLYISSGLLTPVFAEMLEKLGFRYVIVAGPSIRPACRTGGLLVIPALPVAAATPADVRQAFSRASGAMIVTANPSATEGIASAFASVFPSSVPVRWALPDPLDSTVPACTDTALPAEAYQWMRRPGIWRALAAVRSEIDAYRASGMGDAAMLDTLRGELYQLYRADRLWSLIEGSSTDDDQRFFGAVSNIYRLIGKTVPEEVLDEHAQDRGGPDPEYRVERTASGVIFHNSISSLLSPLRSFSVNVGTNTVSFSVEIDSGIFSSGAYVEIYIDLNNQRGAGATAFLPGNSGFVRPDDAWEYAIRISGRQAQLYRSTRAAPTLIRSLTVSRQWTVDVPRGVLRGNPYNWGYAVMSLQGRDGSLEMGVVDILCQDDYARQEALSKSPLQIEAVRIE